MSGIYGSGWREFLQALEIKPPARLRSLNIDPPWPWLLALEKQTGVAAAFMRDQMTFERLSMHMTWFVHQAAPCRVCMAANKQPTGARQVEWLDDLAPWQLVCDRHRCPALASEIGNHRVRDIIDRDVRALRHSLRSAACSDFHWPFPSVPLTAATCVDMVTAINSRLRLRVRAIDTDHVVFAVDDILMAPQIDEGARPWPRNSRAISAWYAWHVLACPEVVLYRQTRCHNADQTYNLLTVLFDFRHTGILNDQWEYALRQCAKADAGPNGSTAERRQVRQLHDPMFRSLIAHARPPYTPRAVHH